MTHWQEYNFKVTVPHMVPHKLSEVELLKWLGAYQWESISRLLGVPSNEIRNEQQERLYASFIQAEIAFPPTRPIDHFSEGSNIYFHNHVRAYREKFIEGFFVFNDAPVESATLDSISQISDLAIIQHPWAYLTNAFITIQGGNTQLRVSSPLGIDDILEGHDQVTVDTPPSLLVHAQVERTGTIEFLTPDGYISQALIPYDQSPILYTILPESDINSAGLLYFARYVAIMNYGERIFLTQRLAHNLSTSWVAGLSTEHRTIYYFSNANPSDVILIKIQAYLLLPTTHLEQTPILLDSPPIRFSFHVDLYRQSDYRLIASSQVTKALVIAHQQKSLLAETGRFLNRTLVQ